MGKGNLLKFAIGTALVAIGGYMVYRKMKKSSVPEQTKETETTDITPEVEVEEIIEVVEEKIEEEKTLESLCQDENNNLVKDLYEHYRFSPDYDEDLISVDKILGIDGTSPEQKVIHIGISEIRGIPHCTLGFEIPTWTEPRALGSFISTLKRIGEGLFNEFTPLSKYNLKNRLKAQFMLEYRLEDDESKELRYSLIEVPRELHEIEPFIDVDEDGRIVHDGLSKYVAYIRELLDNADKNKEELSLDDSGKNWVDVRIKDIVLSYSLSYPIATPDNLGGLTEESGYKILDRFTNQVNDIDLEKVEIKPRFGKSVEYVGILFYNSFSEEVEVYEAKEPNESGKYPIKRIKITY